MRSETLISRRSLLFHGFAALPVLGTSTQLETLTDWLRADDHARAGRLSSLLTRIEAADDSIHAWVQVLPQKPTGKGLLWGIPFGVKDVIETRGLATEYGSPVYKGRVGTADAVIVQQLRSRGAVLAGKTHTAAFAMRDPAPTRNPRNLNHTPGGSSSGSAAAVAAGMVPFAIGTQTAGSVVRPASYCGVTGFKTTFGVFSVQGVLPYARSLDTLGFFTHTPEDMLRLWEALGRVVAREETLTVGVPDPMPNVEPVMAGAVQNAVHALRDAGVATRPIKISAMLDALIDAHRTIMYFEGAKFHQNRVKQYSNRLGYLATLVRDGLQIPDALYREAKRVVNDCKARFNDAYSGTPVIVVPAATGPAPLGLAFTGDSRMNAPWTALGTPAISIPMPVGQGLPLGLQLTAAPGDDARLLHAAVRVHGIVTKA